MCDSNTLAVKRGEERKGGEGSGVERRGEEGRGGGHVGEMERKGRIEGRGEEREGGEDQVGMKGRKSLVQHKQTTCTCKKNFPKYIYCWMLLSTVLRPHKHTQLARWWKWLTQTVLTCRAPV